MTSHARANPRGRSKGAFAMSMMLGTMMLATTNPASAERPGGGVSGGDTPRCGVPVPAGSKLVFHAYADGVQIYRWDGAAWAFVAPDALLYADAGFHGIIGLHYGGPTWESVSGSMVVGTVIDRCPMDPASIPWLLLSATPDDGPGIFHRVSFIERVNTVGGIAPSSPGNVIGEIAEVPYTADYLFYRSK
jgi:hypothetical protein